MAHPCWAIICDVSQRLEVQAEQVNGFMGGRVEVRLKIERRAMHGDWPCLGKASGRSI